MAKITDDDDVNLDDIETTDPDPAQQDDGDPADDGTDEDPEGESDDPVDDAADEGGEEPDAVETQRGSSRQGREQPDRQGGRADRRVQVVTNENRELRDTVAGLNRRIDEILARQNQAPAQPRETDQQRNERRAMMSETERAAEDIRSAEQRMTAQLNQTQFQLADQTDRSAYESKATVDPLFKRWSPKVEAELAKLRSQGQSAPREAILRYLIGAAALESRGSKGNRTAEALGRRRVQRQTTQPGNNRSDERTSRRGTGKSLEDRLAGQVI